MSSSLTFEFPDARSARRFAERVDDDNLGIPHVHHRVVDVVVDASATENMIVVAARRFGASVPEPVKDEPLYLLKIGVGFAGDVLRDTEVSLTTASAFIEANGVQGQLAVSALTEPGAVTHGGGGASPRWRLERTAYHALPDP